MPRLIETPGITKWNAGDRIGKGPGLPGRVGKVNHEKPQGDFDCREIIVVVVAGTLPGFIISRMNPGIFPLIYSTVFLMEI